jgi:hypothetical protein
LKWCEIARDKGLLKLRLKIYEKGGVWKCLYCLARTSQLLGLTTSLLV